MHANLKKELNRFVIAVVFGNAAPEHPTQGQEVPGGRSASWTQTHLGDHNHGVLLFQIFFCFFIVALMEWSCKHIF